jgi:hypothetical protein
MPEKKLKTLLSGRFSLHQGASTIRDPRAGRVKKSGKRAGAERPEDSRRKKTFIKKFSVITTLLIHALIIHSA